MLIACWLQLLGLHRRCAGFGKLSFCALLGFQLPLFLPLDFLLPFLQSDSAQTSLLRSRSKAQPTSAVHEAPGTLVIYHVALALYLRSCPILPARRSTGPLCSFGRASLTLNDEAKKPVGALNGKEVRGRNVRHLDKCEAAYLPGFAIPRHVDVANLIPVRIG